MILGRDKSFCFAALRGWVKVRERVHYVTFECSLKKIKNKIPSNNSSIMNDNLYMAHNCVWEKCIKFRLFLKNVH